LKLPYSLQTPELGSCRLLLRLRIFPPNIVSITVRLKLLERSLSDIPIDSLFVFRNPRSIKQVHDVVTWSLGLIGSVSKEQRVLAVSTRQFFGVNFSNVAPPQDIPGFWAENKRRIVGLLIGNEAHTEMREEIVNRVTAKCDDLNLKLTSEYLLVNKQGTILISPIGASGYTHKNRFQQAMDLAEIGLVYREFLDNIYPERRKGANKGFLDYIFRIVQAWITQPDAILNISYSNKLHWQLLASEFGLPQKLSLVKAQNPWLDQHIEDASLYFAQFGDHWWDTPNFAATFPEII